MRENPLIINNGAFLFISGVQNNESKNRQSGKMGLSGP
jgi:hypothetical protein